MFFSTPWLRGAELGLPLFSVALTRLFFFFTHPPPGPPPPSLFRFRKELWIVFFFPQELPRPLFTLQGVCARSWFSFFRSRFVLVWAPSPSAVPTELALTVFFFVLATTIPPSPPRAWLEAPLRARKELLPPPTLASFATLIEMEASLLSLPPFFPFSVYLDLCLPQPSRKAQLFFPNRRGFSFFRWSEGEVSCSERIPPSLAARN